MSQSQSVEITDVSVDIPEKYLESLVAEMPEYRPFVVRVDSPHASYVEFGTTGNDNRKIQGKGNEKKAESEFSKHIKDWLRKRGAAMGGRQSGVIPNNEPTEDQLAFVIMKKLIEEGMPPQPFIRPAVHTVEKEIEEGVFEDATMKDVADELYSLMVMNLEDNHTIYSGGDIVNTISIEWLSPNEMERAEGGPMVGGQPIPERVWADDYADWNGNTDRARARKNNIRNLRF